MLLSFVAIPLLAQEATAPKLYSAGGKWTYQVSADKLTGALYGIFELEANEKMTDGIGSGVPSFVIMCGGTAKTPIWINSKLLSPAVLGSANSRSVLEAPQQIVQLRSDSKIHVHRWNMADDFKTFFVDKSATKELLNGHDVRIQFRDVSEHEQVATFSPAEIKLEILTKACGNAFK